MKNRIKSIVRLLPILFLGWVMSACETPDSASLFDENYQALPAPVISSVTPEGGTFAGYLEIVINGSNFSSTPANNLVYFNARRATILSASPTQLLVRTPNMVADSIGIKVAVLGVESFSNSWQYRLESLFEDVIEFSSAENPWAATRDSDGNYYVSLEASGSPAGVRKYNPDGTVAVETYAPSQSWFYRASTVDNDGNLYLVRGGAIPFIYRVTPGGSAAVSWRSGVGRTEDVIFARNHIWSAGTNEGNAANSRINRTAMNGTTLDRYPFNAQVYALAYFDNYLYVAGTRSDVSTIWRLPLDADLVPGDEQEIAQITGVDGRPASIAVAADGTVLVGFNTGRRLFEVSPTGTVQEIYEGILTGNILKMEFIPGTQRILATIVPSEGRNRVIWLNVQRNAP
jgi:sugar lactone lactonase YvrE